MLSLKQDNAVKRAAPRKFLALLVVFSLALFSTARAQDPIAEFPYRYDYAGWITISVTVNGEGPYDFIIDTGATLTVAFENLNQRQNFPYVEGDPKRILGLIQANYLPPRYIGDLNVGGVAFDNLTSVVIGDWAAPRATPQGVLGLDFFYQYAAYIDPSTKTIRLYDTDVSAIAQRRKWTSVPLQPKLFSDAPRPLYTLKARIRSRNYPFILDLGASGTVINYEALQAMLSTNRMSVRSISQATRIGQVQDLFGNKAQSRPARIQKMKIGRATWRNKIVSVYDAEVFKELGVADQPYGLLGADMIQDRHVIIDIGAEQIHFGPKLRKRD